MFLNRCSHTRIARTCCLVQLVATFDEEEGAAAEALHTYLRTIFSTLALFFAEPGAVGLRLEGTGALLLGSFLMLIGALFTALLFGSVAQAVERASLMTRE